VPTAESSESSRFQLPEKRSEEKAILEVLVFYRQKEVLL
jgi:hypothetical protein